MPATPQVPALPGMTPFGVKPQPKSRITTIAEVIADRFGDGMRFRDEDGVPLHNALVTLGAAVYSRCGREGDKTRYSLPDGSVITIVGDGWDLGYSDCFCWQGVGHTCAEEQSLRKGA